MALDPHINPASGVWDDNYYAQTHGAANSLISSAVDTYAQLADAYNTKSKQFDAANPFNFDDVLAKETASAKHRLDPYYAQTLSDYLTGINLKKTRSLEDQRTLLGNLNADTNSYEGKDKIALADTLERTRQGFADAGTYFSGARLRAEGQTVGNDQRNLTDYLRGQDAQANQINTNTQRTQQDLALEQKQQQRDLGSFDANGNYQEGATPAATVQSQSLNAANQDQNLYNYHKQAFLGTPPGVNYSDYSANNASILNKI